MRLALSIALFFAWGFASWQWYVCGIHRACAGSEPVAKSEVEITELKDRIVIHFPFKSIVKEVEPEVDAAFEKLAERLRKTQDALQIIGHTDDVGGEQRNLELGMARAAYIHDILLAKGIPSTRMCVESKGEGEPVADNASEEGKRRNRRVEILLENQGTPQGSVNLPRK